MHKATHHFDLVNWWLSTVPEEVYAVGTRNFYRPETAERYGFTKRGDLCYFLRALLAMEYHETPILAPDESILREYRKTNDWDTYERHYLELIRRREVEKHIEPDLFEDGIVLLCSEADPAHCHRRLAAEYLAHTVLAGADIKHL